MGYPFVLADPVEIKEIKDLMDKFTEDLPGILAGVSTSFTALGGYFDTLRTKIEAALNAFNLAATTFTGVDLNNPDTWEVEDLEVENDDVILEIPSPGPTNTTDNTSMETEAKNIANNAADLLERVHTANLGGYKADGSAGGWKTYARAAGYSEEVIGLVSKALNDSRAGGGYSYFYNKAKELLGLASGGYTGEWGPEGRLALLHQKELVLNSQDTENFLAGINILREIAKAIDL
jgi:hypothetical protein